MLNTHSKIWSFSLTLNHSVCLYFFSVLLSFSHVTVICSLLSLSNLCKPLKLPVSFPTSSFRSVLFYTFFNHNHCKASVLWGGCMHWGCCAACRIIQMQWTRDTVTNLCQLCAAANPITLAVCQDKGVERGGCCRGDH